MGADIGTLALYSSHNAALPSTNGQQDRRRRSLHVQLYRARMVHRADQPSIKTAFQPRSHVGPVSHARHQRHPTLLSKAPRRRHRAPPGPFQTRQPPRQTAAPTRSDRGSGCSSARQGGRAGPPVPLRSGEQPSRTRSRRKPALLYRRARSTTIRAPAASLPGPAQPSPSGETEKRTSIPRGDVSRV